LYFYSGFGGGETGQLFICPHLRQAAERYFMTTLKLTNFKILTTGADGGHHYVSTEIEYKVVRRKITVFLNQV